MTEDYKNLSNKIAQHKKLIECLKLTSLLAEYIQEATERLNRILISESTNPDSIQRYKNIQTPIMNMIALITNNISDFDPQTTDEKNLNKTISKPKTLLKQLLDEANKKIYLNNQEYYDYQSKKIESVTSTVLYELNHEFKEKHSHYLTQAIDFLEKALKCLIFFLGFNYTTTYEAEEKHIKKSSKTLKKLSNSSKFYESEKNELNEILESSEKLKLFNNKYSQSKLKALGINAFFSPPQKESFYSEGMSKESSISNFDHPMTIIQSL